MTDTTNTTAATSGKSPSHVAYQVRDRGEGKKAIWTRIGSAWQHADSKGFNIQLDAVPLDGRISLRHSAEEK
jgi:hypothetical protein